LQLQDYSMAPRARKALRAELARMYQEVAFDPGNGVALMM
jgi:hypothetical protein